jgi:hypothetical protein
VDYHTCGCGSCKWGVKQAVELQLIIGAAGRADHNDTSRSKFTFASTFHLQNLNYIHAKTLGKQSLELKQFKHSTLLLAVSTSAQHATASTGSDRSLVLDNSAR